MKRLLLLALFSALPAFCQFGNATFLQNVPICAPLTRTNNYIVTYNSSTGCFDTQANGGASGSVTTGVTLTADLPVIGAGGAAVAIGTRTGNTTKYTSSTGSLTSGHAASWDASGNIVDAGFTATAPQHKVTMLFNGGGSAISTGDLALFPGSGAYTGTINRIDVSGAGTAGATCSATADIWKRNAVIPTSSQKISASAPATLSSANLSQSGSLSGWTTAVAANDVWSATLATNTGCITFLIEVYYQ